MFIGAHCLLYTPDPLADRAFVRDVLGFRAVDAGDGWLIFALPPSELAFHPLDHDAAPQFSSHVTPRAVLYLMCADVRAVVQTLTDKNVPCGRIREEPWGIQTTLRLPSGCDIGLYQPRHPTAIG